MNINPTYPNFPMANLTPSTDSLRRENTLREFITQPAEVHRPAAEKGAASDFDKVKTPGQQNEQSNLVENQKQADANRSTIGERGSEQQQEGQQQQTGQQNDSSKEDASGNVVSQVEQQQIKELEFRDAEVRAHEAAHSNTAGSHGGAPTYTYQTGPDGKRYAVGGEVSVDLSRIPNDPRATIRKMQQVHAAALAPASPSSQDMQVASTAMRIMAEAQRDLLNVTIDPEATQPQPNIDSVDNAQLDETDNDSIDIEHQPSQASLKEDDDNVENTVFASKRSELKSEEQPVEEAVFSSNNRQTDDVIRRSLRIQNHYLNINYTRSQSYQISA